ncbi:MAG: ABC transporter substrate-binding protein [Caldilineaceae bacterium]
MRLLNRKAQFVFLFILLPLLTTRCGSEPEVAKPAAMPAAAVRWVTWDANNQLEALLVKQFQETHPQIEFKREEMNAPLDTYISKPPRPDMVNLEAGYELDNAIRKNQVADLTDIWIQAGLLDAIPASIQKASVHDGKQYYLPTGFGWEAIYYNKQIFAKYNLQPPKTWEEFLKLCDTLLSHGETPLAISGSEYTGNYWFEYLDLRLNGPEFHRGLLAGKEHFTDARVRRVLETWKGLFDAGYFVEGRGALGDLSTLTALVRNDEGQLHQPKAVMALSDTYAAGQLLDKFQAELGFFRFPVIEPNVAVAEVIDPSGYAVPVGAEHIPEALAFLTHLSAVGTQNLIVQNELFQAVKFAPARSDLAADHLNAEQKQALEMVKSANDTVVPFFNAVPREMLGMVEYVYRRFINEPKDIDGFLQKFEEARQKMVEQGKLGQE